MPIYEYQCQKCQTIFEEWQSGFEDREMPCPECGEESKRLISHTSFQLKGSGWYVTDYGGKNPSGGETGENSGGTDGKEAKADSGDTSTTPAPRKESSDTSSAGSAS